MKIFLAGGTGATEKINDKSRQAAAPAARLGTDEV
jgi:hypothetical protein